MSLINKLASSLALVVSMGVVGPGWAEEPRFGMRLRKPPEHMNAVFAPVVVRESPENEAEVVRLPDGSLTIDYIARPAGKTLRALTSTDSGLTWGNDRLEFDLPGAAYHAVHMILDSDEELHAFFHVFRGDGKQPGVDRNLDVWHCKTSNRRTTWGQPRRLFEGYVGALRGGIQLKNGRLVVPFARAVPERFKPPPEGRPDHGWHNVVVFYSDDKGETWNRSPNELKVLLNGRNTTRYGAIEPNVIALKDGRVWMLIRDRGGRLWESYSQDEGVAWSDPKPGRFVSSDSPASTLRLGDGRMLLFWCCNQRWDNPRSYAMGGREALHAAISADEGKSWQGFREVLVEPEPAATRGDRGSAYSSAAENKNGKVVFVSGQGEGRKAVVLFDPDWLTQTSATDDFSRGLEQWTLHGSRGAGLVGHPDQKDAKVLSVRKVDPQAPAGAVWNFPAGVAGRLTTRIRLRPGCNGATLSLTDHFSVVDDRKAEDHAVFCLRIDSQGRIGPDADLQPGRWYDLTLEWTADDADAVVRLDGRRASTLKPLRKSGTGINYLRVNSPADPTDESGFLIASVQADVSAPGQAQAGSRRVRAVGSRSNGAARLSPR